MADLGPLSDRTARPDVTRHASPSSDGGRVPAPPSVSGIEVLRDVLHERYGELLAVCDGFHTEHDDDWEGYWTKEAEAIIEAIGWRKP